MTKKRKPKNTDKTGKKSRGRPTGYSKDTIKKAQEYINQAVDKTESLLESVNEKTGRERFVGRLKVNLPKAEGLALYLGVHRDTLYEWAKVHKEFSDILERVNQIQADRVINEALSGNYNPLIAKLLLGKHGYKDKSEQDITSGGLSLSELFKKAKKEDEG